MSMEALVAPPRPLRLAALPGWLRSSTVLTTVALAGIMAGAVALRVWALARQGFWYDEAMTARLVAETPGQMLAALPHTESTPPLYYLLASGWARLFGDTEAGLRSLSALAGTAAVPVTFLAARDVSSRRAGLVAALLVAVNPVLVWYSQEARAYSLFVLVTALSFWLFARAHARPTIRRLVAWGLVSALALCTHYFAVFVVAAEALLLLAVRRAPLRRRLAGAGIVAAAAGALAGLAWTQHTHARWQGVFALRVRAEQLPTQLLAGFTPPATRLALGLIAAAAAVAVVLGLCLGSRFERRGALLAGAVATAAVLVPIGIAALGIDYVNTR